MFEKRIIDQIGNHLRRFGWQNFDVVDEPGEKEGVVRTGWSGFGGVGHAVVIDPVVEKKALQLKARQVASAPADTTAVDRLNGLLLAMAALNYKLILGSWGYDPRDGEVIFRVSMPLHGDRLDYPEFEHCLQALVAGVEVDGPSLRAIVDGTKTAQDVVMAEGLQLAL